jgi:hypothetical protein
VVDALKCESLVGEEVEDGDGDVVVDVLRILCDADE